MTRISSNGLWYLGLEDAISVSSTLNEHMRKNPRPYAISTTITNQYFLSSRLAHPNPPTPDGVLLPKIIRTKACTGQQIVTKGSDRVAAE
eukprot:g37210.t1